VIYYFVLRGDAYILTNRHVVTAVGRAREAVHVIGSRADFDRAVRTPFIARRSTVIHHFQRGYMLEQLKLNKVDEFIDIFDVPSWAEL
jgi:hypothetical protein